MPDPREPAAASPGWRALVGQGAGGFVGREPEMEVLLSGLRDAVSGRGRLILLGGEPGIGKTRLADEFSAAASEEGALVLWGRCWEAGGAPAYWPWTQSIRGLLSHLEPGELTESVGEGGSHLAQILPELRQRLRGLPELPPASPERARFQLFDALSRFLGRAARERPLALILEDLHAADAPSLLLLRFVAAELGGSRVLLLGTYRDVELTKDHDLAAALPELTRAQTAVRVTLSGLSEPDVARFIETITGDEPPGKLVAAVHRETEGNPLFVEEVVRLLASEGRLRDPVDARSWPIPEGVREVIGRRLGRLPEGCRRMLSLGCVVGRDFTVDVLERLAGRSAEAVLDVLEDAVAARLVGEVSGEPGRLRFAHSLVRDTLYEDLMPADRIRLHRQVGEALEALYGGDPEPHIAELAYHFYEAAPATDLDKAVEYAIRAGTHAVGVLAYEEAVRLFRMAFQLLRESPDEKRRCEVLLLLGDAQGRSGDAPGSKETFLEAAEIATRLDLPEHLARAAFGYGGRFHWMRAGLDRHLIPLLKQALEALGPDDSVLRALLLGRLSGALRDQPSVEARATLAREAVAVARRIGDPETLAYALLAQAWAEVGPDGVERQQAFAEELDRLVGEIGDRERLVDVGVFRFLAFTVKGEAVEARAQQEMADRLAGELQQPSQQWMAGLMATVLALEDGRFGEAERLIEETLEAGRQAQPWDAEATSLFARFVLRREQGRLDELEEELREAPARYPGYRSFRCMLLAALGDLGRLEEARVHFDRLAADDFARFPKDNEWLFALTLLAEAAQRLGHREGAAVLYRQLRPYEGLVGQAGGEVSAGPVARALGLLARTLGRYEEAERHFERAVNQARGMGARPWVAHAQHEHAAMLAERGSPGDRDRAVDLLAEARQLCEPMGMTALERRVSELLAALGEHPRTRAPAGRRPKGTALTPREREVAGLVAEGLSNRQIAERLYVSERTAETHVQHILTKLGFHSRAQIAGWAVRERLLDQPSGT